MGAFHSVTEHSPYYYLDAPKLRETRFCRCCGTVYHQHDVVDNPQPHYPSVLCGIWLTRPDEAQSPEHIKHTSDAHSSSPVFSKVDELSFNGVDSGTLPTTRLPKRKTPLHKPSHVAATLLKYTDFTKTERSALKRGFFSVINVNLTDSPDYSQLEGCHIHGCLFVEHGNLVFQAVDCRAQLPSLLTKRIHVGNTLPTHHSTDFNVSNYRLRRVRESDSFLVFPDSVRSSQHSVDVPCRESQSVSISFTFKRTRHKLLSYLRDAYGLAAKSKLSCRNCHSKMGFKNFPHSCQLSRVTSPQNIKTRNSSSRSDCDRLPPPPLRLTWPISTLRRFGFYENSLFKLESGRRAPRGEGHYLFVIKGLKEFRQYFEQYVHRRKSTPPLNPSQEIHPQTPSLCDFLYQHDLPNDTCVTTSSPNLSPSCYCTSRGVRSHSTTVLASPTENVPDSYNRHAHVDKKTEYQRHPDLTHYSPSATHYQRWSLNQMKTIPVQGTPRFVRSLASNASTLPVRAINSPIYINEGTTDSSTLPDPPPLPPLMSVYDNVDSTLSASLALSNKFTSQVNKPSMTRAWLNSLSTPSSGRVYTSRRAATSFIHSEQCARICGLSGGDVCTNLPRSRTLRTTEQSNGTHPRASICSHISLPRPPLKHSGSTAATTRGARTNNLNESQRTSLSAPVWSASVLAITQPNKEKEPDITNFIDSDMVAATESQLPPYYNLHSPEALFQIGRSNSLSHPMSSTKTESPNGKMKRCISVPHSSSSAQVKTTLRIRPCLLIEPDCTCPILVDRSITGERNVDVTPNQRHTLAFVQSNSDTENHMAGRVEVRCTRPEHDRCTLNTLHYASLDFGRPTTGTMENDDSIGLAHLSRSSNHSPTYGSASESQNCSASAYGTLVSRSALTPHGRVRSFSSSEPGTHSANNESAGHELPTNYVAICQLQTLAMRAVLNATT